MTGRQIITCVMLLWRKYLERYEVNQERVEVFSREYKFIQKYPSPKIKVISLGLADLDLLYRSGLSLSGTAVQSN